MEVEIKLTQEETRYLEVAVEKERSLAFHIGDDDRLFSLTRISNKLKEARKC